VFIVGSVVGAARFGGSGSRLINFGGSGSNSSSNKKNVKKYVTRKRQNVLKNSLTGWQILFGKLTIVPVPVCI